MQAGEELIGYGSDYSRAMHRTCLDNWLKEHPPIEGAKAQKVLSAEETEREFEKLRRQLLRTAKTPAPRKPRSKTTS